MNIKISRMTTTDLNILEGILIEKFDEIAKEFLDSVLNKME